MTSKSNAIALADALEREFGWLDEEEIDWTGDAAWREDPLPIARFMKEHLNIDMWEVQQEDFESFLGSTVEDTKRLFTQNPPTSYNCAALVWGKGCLGADEQLTDHLTGKTRSVKEWAEIAEPLLLLSWDERAQARVLTWTGPVYHKGTAELCRITLTDGRSFVATDYHRCLARSGWLRVGEFGAADPVELLTESGKYEPVESVQAIGSGEYYDLTVPITHCYFDTQGILHHNSGKDLISSAALAWFVHVLLCLKNPQKFLGLEPTEAIDIALASPTLRQTRRITFTKFKNRLRRWQWLKDLLPMYGIKNPDRYLQLATEAADYVELPCSIRIHNLPLNSNSAEGFNIIAFIISEYAALQTEATSESATAAFETFVSSGRTRFQKAWKAFLTSFPRSYNDPQEQLIRAREEGMFPELYVVRRPTWEVHPNRTYEDFASDFERNPEDSWAKYGARPRAAVDSYFRSPHLLLLHASGAPISLLHQHRDLLEQSFDGLNDDEIEQTLERISSLGRNPITEVDRFGDPILDRRGFPKLARWFRGQTAPSGEPYSYFAHLDPGLGGGDAFGLAIGHLHELPDGKYQPVLDLAFRWTGRMFRDFGEIYRPAWFEDTIEQFQTITAAEVDFRTVREFLFFLNRARGFEFELVSFDGWNSAESIQALRQRDIPVSVRVVGKPDYDCLKETIYSRQLRYFAQPVLISELLKLQLINGTKVEAPRTVEGDSGKSDSHKDVSDAVAAVVRHLVLLKDESTEFVKLPPPETWWEKPQFHDRSGEPGKTIAPDPETLSHIEREMWKAFFEE